MKIIEEIKIMNLEDRVRLSDIDFRKFNFIHSRKGFVKAIKRGDILLNQERAYTADYVKNSDTITLIEQEEITYKSYQRKLDIVYEDDYLAIINKPAGVDVSGNKFRTIENMLLSNIKTNKSNDGLKKLRPVHRLDNQTSGLLLIAKTSHSLIELSKQFQNREITKKYTAIVVGKLACEGIIDSPIGKSQALTKFRVLEYCPSLKAGVLSLVELRLFTGRTHQLRIHLASINHQILGDKLYGKPELMLLGKGLFLTASELSFRHPLDGRQLSFKLDLPHKFRAHLNREMKRFKKYQAT